MNDGRYPPAVVAIGPLMPASTRRRTRMTRLSRMMLWVVTILLLLAGSRWSVPAVAQQPVDTAGQQPTDTVDQAIDLGSQNQDLGEIDRFPLQITGFAVGNY